MPFLVPFAPWHLNTFANRDGQIAARWPLNGSLGPAFTAIDGLTVIGSAGLVTKLPQGLGLPWMALADNIKDNKLWFVKTVQRELDQAVTQCGITHLEAHVLVDNVKNKRFIEALGFVAGETYVKYHREIK